MAYLCNLFFAIGGAIVALGAFSYFISLLIDRLSTCFFQTKASAIFDVIGISLMAIGFLSLVVCLILIAIQL